MYVWWQWHIRFYRYFGLCYMAFECDHVRWPPTSTVVGCIHTSAVIDTEIYSFNSNLKLLASPLYLHLCLLLLLLHHWWGRMANAADPKLQKDRQNKSTYLVALVLICALLVPQTGKCFLYYFNCMFSLVYQWRRESVTGDGQSYISLLLINDCTQR